MLEIDTGENLQFLSFALIHSMFNALNDYKFQYFYNDSPVFQPWYPGRPWNE